MATKTWGNHHKLRTRCEHYNEYTPWEYYRKLKDYWLWLIFNQDHIVKSVPNNRRKYEAIIHHVRIHEVYQEMKLIERDMKIEFIGDHKQLQLGAKNIYNKNHELRRVAT